jgi:sugar porter (SP) family MFS transporter
MAIETKSTAASPATKDPAYVAVSTPNAELEQIDQETAETRHRVNPTYILWTSAMLAFVLPLQFGWSTSQLNYRKFNNVEECNARPVAEGTCIMFPGHTKFQWTIVVNAWIVGGMIGSGLVGKFADKFGRKQVLIYNCGFIIAGAIIMAVVSNLWAFAVGRLLAGIASGATTGNVGGYMNEISPPQHRSVLGAVLHSGITAGILLGATTFFYMDFSSGWRYIAAFPIVLAAIFLSMSPFLMVESPVWLLMKGRRAEAEAVLTRLFGAEGVPVALEWIESKRKHDMEMQSSTWSETGNDVVRNGKGVPFSELIAPALRRQFIIAFGVAVMQKITGINTVFYYSSDLFTQAGLSNVRVSAVVIDIVNMLPTLVSGFFASRFGNRRMLLCGLAGMFVSAIGVTLSLSFNWSALSILFIATYVGSFGVSLGPLMYVVIADIFPDYARASVSSICVLTAWSANLVVGVGYPYISSALDDLAYLPFVVLLAISFVFVFALLPETSGKTNEEIQDEFRAIRQKKRRAAAAAAN